MSYNTPNYTEQGGAKTVIGGEIEVTGTIDLSAATVEGVVTATVENILTSTETGNALSAAQGKALNDKIVALGPIDTLVSTSATAALSAKQGKALKDAADAKVAANQAASSASDVAGLKTDFNALLTKLKAAGLMVADT